LAYRKSAASGKRLVAVLLANCILVILAAKVYPFIFNSPDNRSNVTATITATGQGREEAQGTEIWFTGLEADGKFYSAQQLKILDGKWEKNDDGALGWKSYSPEGVTQSITVQLPYAVSHSFVFQKNIWRGIVEVSLNGAVKSFDCYGKYTDSRSTYKCMMPGNYSPGIIFDVSLKIFLIWLTLAILLHGLKKYANAKHYTIQMFVQNRERILRYTEVACFFVAPILIGWFLAYNSVSSTPLVRGFYGYDASGYSFYANAWREGLIPYRDTFVNKGPILFVIFLANAYWGEQWGIFLVQCAAMWASLTGAYCIGKKMSGRVCGLISVLAVLCFYRIVCDEGAIIEEFSLPMLMWALYFIVKYFRSSQIDGVIKHPPMYAFFYGLTFGYMLGMRISDTVYVNAFVFCICVYLLFHRELKNFFQNALAFISGTVLIMLPFMIYFASHDALNGWLQAYTCSIEYSTTARNFSRDDILRIAFYLTPVWMCILTAVDQKPLIRRSVITASVSTILWLYHCNLFTHYYVIVIPFIPLFTGLFFHKESYVIHSITDRGGKLSVQSRLIPLGRYVMLNRYRLAYFGIVLFACLCTLYSSKQNAGGHLTWIHSLQSQDTYEFHFADSARTLLQNVSEEDADSVVMLSYRRDYISNATGIYPRHEKFGGIQYLVDMYSPSRPGREEEIRAIYENIPYEDMPAYIVVDGDLNSIYTLPCDIIQTYLDQYYQLDNQVAIEGRDDYTLYLYKKT